MTPAVFPAPEKGAASAPTRRAAFLATALWIFAVWVAFPDFRDLVQPDEGRYAEIPREMVATGDWITPRLDGLKYFEKPPLQYWATAVAFELFGNSNATARAWPVLLGLLTALWVFFLGRRLYDAETGACAAVLLASGVMWVCLGHLLTLDMGLSAFLALAFGALAWAQTHRGEPARVLRWMLVAWVALAAAVLSKGPVAIVLTGGPALVYSLWRRDLAMWKHLHLGKGLLLFLAIAGPWFVIVGRRNPGFTSFFFLHENFDRYTTDVHRRVQPWWTYVPVVLLGSLPWIRPSLRALLRPGFAARSKEGGFDPTCFLWVFCIFTVVFFSLSHSKLVPYVLPVFPALALLAARNFRDRQGLALEVGIVLSLGLALGVISFFPEWVADEDLPRAIVSNYRPFVFASSGALLVGGSLALALRMRGLRGVACLGGTCLLAFQSLLLGHQSLSPITSSRELARAVAASIPKDAPVFDVMRYDQPLPFYLGRTIEVVDYRGELDYGLTEAPERVIPDLEAFRRIWTGLAQGAAVMSKEDHVILSDSGFPMRTVFEDPRRVAVVRR